MPQGEKEENRTFRSDAKRKAFASLLRNVRWPAALLLAAAALTYRYFGTRNGPPSADVGSLVPAMNLRIVRVEGRVTGRVLRLGGGGAFFRLDDGTGVLPVFFSTAGDGRLPESGARVSARGNVRCGADGRFRMNAYGVERLLAGEEMLGDAGSRVVLTGRVVRVWSAPRESPAPDRIVLELGDGRQVEVVSWLEDLSLPERGDWVRISGRVESRDGRKRLRLSSREDVRRLDPRGRHVEKKTRPLREGEAA